VTFCGFRDPFSFQLRLLRFCVRDENVSEIHAPATAREPTKLPCASVGLPADKAPAISRAVGPWTSHLQPLPSGRHWVLTPFCEARTLCARTILRVAGHETIFFSHKHQAKRPFFRKGSTAPLGGSSNHGGSSTYSLIRRPWGVILGCHPLPGLAGQDLFGSGVGACSGSKKKRGNTLVVSGVGVRISPRVSATARRRPMRVAVLRNPGVGDRWGAWGSLLGFRYKLRIDSCFFGAGGSAIGLAVFAG